MNLKFQEWGAWPGRARRWLPERTAPAVASPIIDFTGGNFQFSVHGTRWERLPATHRLLGPVHLAKFPGIRAKISLKCSGHKGAIWRRPAIAPHRI